MTMQTVAFDYAETGSGPALLFLPGSFGTGAGWKAVIGYLGSGYRMVTTSLLGYGSTPDIRPDGNATMAQQVGLIDRIGTSPHVVGHSYGGLSAIVHALTGRHRPASLLLVEANPLGLLRASGDLEHYGMFESMTGPYFADFTRGDAEAARHVIDFYGGPGTFDSMPPKVRSYIVATTPVNVRDWSSGTPFEPSKETRRSTFRQQWFAEEAAILPCKGSPSFCTIRFLKRSSSRSKAGVTSFRAATQRRSLHWCGGRSMDRL
jgi:pimeloyl-ACP methyl ester carboxylesterase